MASIIPNTKNGKIVSYKFKACVGRDELGKQVFKCTTWKIPDGLAVSRVERAAQRAADSWERQAKETEHVLQIIFQIFSHVLQTVKNRHPYRAFADPLNTGLLSIACAEDYAGFHSSSLNLRQRVQSVPKIVGEVFYPELERESPAIRQLRLIVEKCNEAEAAALIPVFQSVLSAMRTTDSTDIK